MKYHVFFILKQYSIASKRAAIRAAWEDVIGAENILELEEPRAVVDVMLGAIAVRSGARTVQGYMEDMVKRGQDANRQRTVEGLLGGLPAAYGSSSNNTGQMQTEEQLPSTNYS